MHSCVIKLKTPNSDHINAQVLITVWVVAGAISPMSLTPPCKQGQCGVGGRGKNKTGELKTFVFSLSCTLLLENGGMDFGGQQFGAVLVLKVAEGKVGIREAIHSVRHNPLSLPPSFIASTQCSTVQFSKQASNP